MKHNTIKPLQIPKEVDLLRDCLADNPRDLLLFEALISTGLRLNDLLPMKVKDLMELLTEQNSVKSNGFNLENRAWHISPELISAHQRLVKAKGLSDDDYVFSSRKGGSPLRWSSASHLIRKWFNQAGLQGLSGARSLQKTADLLKSSHGESFAAQEPVNNLRPANNFNLQETVYNELYRAITSGQILPGSRLVTEQIARQMGVSPSPVREALKRLEAAGFIDPPTSKGSLVSELTTENISEILTIRLALESILVSKATANISPAIIKRLESLQREYEKATGMGKTDKSLELNYEFHFSIYDQAKMPILINIVKSLWGRLNPYFNIHLNEGGDLMWELTFRHHRELIAMIKDKKPELACQCLVNDLTNSANLVISALKRMRKH